MPAGLQSSIQQSVSVAEGFHAIQTGAAVGAAVTLTASLETFSAHCDSTRTAAEKAFLREAATEAARAAAVDKQRALTRDVEDLTSKVLSQERIITELEAQLREADMDKTRELATSQTQLRDAAEAARAAAVDKQRELAALEKQLRDALHYIRTHVDNRSAERCSGTWASTPASPRSAITASHSPT